MSRSYRKPYATWCNCKDSASQDKKIAARAVRRLQDKSIREFDGDWEDFMMPARYEASGNDVWGWSRDGKQKLQPEPKLEDYLQRVGNNWIRSWWREYTLEEAHEDFNDALERYEDLKRK